ncbi:hypothetical protein D3C71_1647920 [compost metagenome]
MQAESAMVNAPERQAQILGGIDCALLQQKRLPLPIAGRHVMPLGHRPAQALTHGATGLVEKRQVGGCMRLDRQGKIRAL